MSKQKKQQKKDGTRLTLERIDGAHFDRRGAARERRDVLRRRRVGAGRGGGRSERRAERADRLRHGAPHDGGDVLEQALHRARLRAVQANDADARRVDVEKRVDYEGRHGERFVAVAVASSGVVVLCAAHVGPRQREHDPWQHGASLLDAGPVLQPKSWVEQGRRE